MASNVPRQDFSFRTTNEDGRTINVQMLDRINIDDVLVHLVQREVNKLVTNVDSGIDIPRTFRDFLVRERYISR